MYSLPDASLETALNEQISYLKSSLETAQRESSGKEQLEEELLLKQESIAQQHIAIDRLQGEISGHSKQQSGKSCL